MATILVIDDKPANREVLRMVLSYQNHRVLEATDEIEGLAMTRAEHPDLVIADILMPRMDGYEMVQRLRNDPSIAATRVIFYTATYLKSEGTKLAQACGVSHLIIKPSHPQDILNTVNAVLSERAIPALLDDTFDREHLRLWASTRIRLQTEIDGSLTRIVTDRRSLKQVLYNYLSNAIKFTGEGGQVNLRVLPEDDKTFRLEVEDTGIGIAAEDIGKLFVEFQQLDKGAGKRYPDTGLGLALTKRLVENQGGRVGVRSTSGRGSLFYAVLPRVAETGND